ncbi:cytochrome c, mono- and diheme variants family [Terriglobus roseus DSM 18391]|uniref:Cytochrome c, mono-and diheme variants family n=1 Tax=Terriglobus roseus (strain DSM 18391 / NRRL B-41598 / KBS 63) TaxID=926566 RepID=I3ZIR7_TERRK|nr:cytochrome c [Terriglobus roseus]AFL89135.1 cytochrome c, mono- and diheme variants family [Terriglobus roseus DSM 18391]
MSPKKIKQQYVCNLRALTACAALIVAGCTSSIPLEGQASAAPSDQVTPPSAKDGAALFKASGCPFCHGPQGFGTDKAPNLREVRKRKTDEEIFHQIHDGGKMMPPFADALTENEIRSLILFLRAEDGWTLLASPEPSK